MTQGATAMAAVPLNLRIIAKLKRRLEEEAQANVTTLTNEIVTRLRSTLEADQRQGSPPMRRVLERLTQAFLSGGELVAEARGLDRANWLSDDTAFDVAIAAVNREAKAIKDEMRFVQAQLAGQAT
jgi:hypothetical protein